MKKWLAGLALILGFSLCAPAMPASAAAFKDVPDSYWAAEEIKYLSGKKIIGGYTDGRFGLNDTLTRGQAAAMLARALNLDIVHIDKPGFKDITPSYRFYNHIAAATEAGIFAKAAKFNPDDKLTRGQMAIILTRAYKLKATATADFMDANPKQTTYTSVQALASSGVTVGYPDLTFKPDDPVTRGNFAVFMARTMDKKFKPVISVLPKRLYEDVYFPHFISPVKPNQAAAMNKILAAKQAEVKKSAADYHSEGGSDYTLTYTVPSNDKYISVVLDEWIYEKGGAHGVYFLSPYTFSSSGAHFRNLTHFLGSRKAKAEPVLEQAVLRMLRDYEPLLYPFEGIDTDTQQFYIEGNSLVLFYGLYEYTPYAAGIPRVGVPLSKVF